MTHARLLLSCLALSSAFEVFGLEAVRDELTVAAGSSRRLPLPEDAAVSWTSTDPRLVHVTAAGTVHARASKSGGSALIAARESDGTEHCFRVTVPAYVPQFDHSVGISSPSDAECVRDRIIDAVWSGRGFPFTRLPDLVEMTEGVSFPTRNTARAERLTIEMDHGVTVVAFVLYPLQSNSKLIIYLDGHTELDEGRFPVPAMYPADYFVSAGYTVALISMPLYGSSYRPLFSYHGAAKIRLKEHDDLWLLESSELSPLKFFVEPAATVINYMLAAHSMSPSAMVGFSGGGSSALLYAAIDQRVPHTFTIGAFLSPELTWGHWGDYEQIAPELFEHVAEHRNLMVLGTFPARAQTHFLLAHDPTSMALGAERLYATGVASAAEDLSGGHFEHILDGTTFGHEVTPWSLQTIDSTLRDSIE